LSLAATVLTLLVACTTAAEPPPPASDPVSLPAPMETAMLLDDAIRARRSLRSFADTPLDLPAVATLLAAAQGITGPGPQYRAVPSAGALHPLEIYLVAGQVQGLASGVYHYRYEDGSLVLAAAGDQRAALARAALGQQVVGAAPASLVICAAPERTTSKYGPRGQRYVHMEVGHAAQNLYLAATALGLGTVSVGAFEDAEVQRLLDITWSPLLIMPVGHPATD
jgi:SagB-type dehydrogenase family enzyme